MTKIRHQSTVRSHLIALCCSLFFRWRATPRRAGWHTQMDVVGDRPKTGVAGQPVQQTTARIMGVMRAGEAVVFVPAALATAVPPVSLTWLVPTLVAFTVWAAVFAWTAFTRGLRTWLVLGDIAVTCGICLAIGHLMPVERISDGSGWVPSTASLCVVGLPLAWRANRSVPAGLVVVAAFAAGYPLAGHPGLGRWHTATLVGQLFASAVVMALVRRASRVADASLAAAHAERQAAEVSQARRTDEREQLRLLHDTAMTTLTLVGAGVNVNADIVARRAAADLAAVERIASTRPAGDHPVRLDQILEIEIARYAGLLTVASSLSECRVPEGVGAAFAGAVHEALQNVVRHAGVEHATVRQYVHAGQVRVEIGDNGVGFCPSSAPTQRFGVRESIMGRMAAVGGRAMLDSSPGSGTRWALQWPDASAGAPPVDPAHAVAVKYGDGPLRGAIVVTGAWHIFNDLTGVVTGWGEYHSSIVVAAAWLVYAAVGAAAAMALLRGRGRGYAAPLTGVALLLATGALQTAMCPPQLTFTPAHWAWANFGWFAMLLIWRLPVGWLFTAMGSEVLITLVTLVLTRDMDRVDLARYFTVVYGAGSIEIGVAWGARVLENRASAAARAATEKAALQAARTAAEQVHQDRQRRYAEVGQSVRQLLAALAARAVDLCSGDMQRRCALEASRMRRLIAEHDDVPSPLVHELRACADMAERRGVEVSVDIVGVPPDIPLKARRALSDGPMLVLANARHRARITVLSADDEVEVSLVADADPQRLSRPTVAGVTARLSEEDGEVWLRMHWRGR